MTSQMLLEPNLVQYSDDRCGVEKAEASRAQAPKTALLGSQLTVNLHCRDVQNQQTCYF